MPFPWNPRLQSPLSYRTYPAAGFLGLDRRIDVQPSVHLVGSHLGHVGEGQEVGGQNGGLEAVGVASFRHQALGLGDVVGMFVSVSGLTQPGPVQPFLSGPAEPLVRGQRRTDLVLAGAEYFVERLPVQDQVQGAPHANIVERLLLGVDQHPVPERRPCEEHPALALPVILQFLALSHIHVAVQVDGHQHLFSFVCGHNAAGVVDDVVVHPVEVGQAFLEVVLVLLPPVDHVLIVVHHLERTGTKDVLLEAHVFLRSRVGAHMVHRPHLHKVGGQERKKSGGGEVQVNLDLIWVYGLRALDIRPDLAGPRPRHIRSQHFVDAENNIVGGYGHPVVPSGVLRQVEEIAGAAFADSPPGGQVARMSSGSGVSPL